MRATREAAVRHGRETLDAIVGTPLAGEKLDGQFFDGKTEAAIFPGQLPADPRQVFRGDGLRHPGRRRRSPLPALPPAPRSGPDDAAAAHIRLDRACQFLFGDRLT